MIFFDFKALRNWCASLARCGIDGGPLFSKYLIAFSILFCVGLVSPTHLLSDEPPDSSGAAVPIAKEKKKKVRSFFWEAKSDTATVYLLGSVHLAKKNIYPLDSTVEKAFEKSDILVLEINIDQESQMKIQRLMVSQALYGLDDSLESHLSQETLKLLKNKLKEKSLPFESMKQFKPWMLSMQLAMAEWLKTGFNPQDGIDMYFHKKAKKEKKKILALETPESQLEILSSGSDEIQEKNLKHTLENLDKLGSQLEEIFEVWKSGDEKKLDALLKESMTADEYKGLYKKLFTDRNIKMTEKIEGYLKTDHIYFVVVGTGHLIGEGSVVDLLKSGGHQVKRIKVEDTVLSE